MYRSVHTPSVIGLLMALMSAPALSGAVTPPPLAADRPAPNVEPPARPQALFRYTDAAGRTVYTDRSPPGIPARMLPYAPSPPRRPAPPEAPRMPSAAPPSGLQAPPPGPTQQQVLLEQLSKQIASLQSARNALKEGEAVRNGDERNYQRYLDRVQSLRDAVTRQEGVVGVLQEQLRLLGSGALVE